MTSSEGMLGFLIKILWMVKVPDTQKKNAIVFIDGNNFYHNLKLMKITPGDIDFAKISQLVCSHFNCNYKKTIYYNSIPSIADGKEIYYKHIRFINELQKLPNFEVKTRKLQRHSNKEILQEKEELIKTLKLCDKCSPIIKHMCSECMGDIQKKEKGIDIMIATDMLYLCLLKNECDCCILISGDADFVPVIEIIKTNNKEVFSAFLLRGYAYELRNKFKFFILFRNTLVNNCLKT